jgi:hypothetical protein
MGSDRLGDHGRNKKGFAIFNPFNFGCDCVHHVVLVVLKMTDGFVSFQFTSENVVLVKSSSLLLCALGFLATLSFSLDKIQRSGEPSVSG